MNYSDARPGLLIRFAHHDGTRAGGKAAPIFRLRPHVTYIHHDEANPEGALFSATHDGWDRVVVVPHPPYARGKALPFTPENASQFVPASAPPLKPVPPATRRSDRSGTRRRTT